MRVAGVGWLVAVGLLGGCVGAAPVKTCEYDGITYELGDTFDATDGCNTCTCEEDGNVSCTEMGCLTPTGETGAP